MRWKTTTPVRFPGDRFRPLRHLFFLAAAFGLSAVPSLAVTLGDNGEVLDPYVVSNFFTMTTEPGNCWNSTFDMAPVVERCGDEDGCTLRVVASGSARAQSRVHVFAMDFNGHAYSLDQLDGPVLTGSTIDAVRRALVEAKRFDGSTACQLESETFTSSEGLLYLLNCFNDEADGDPGRSGGHTCVVRFDD